MKITSKRKIVRYDSGAFEETNDAIAEEFPLTLYINDVEFATLVCSPDHLEELIMGFLASEGAIRKYSDIKSMNLDDHGGFCHINLNSDISTDHFTYSKRILGSCCGKSRQFYFQSDVDTAKVSMSKTTITPEQCTTLMRDMQDTSTIFKETGGIHNASLGTPEEVIVHRGDIGRHNALDKLYGYCIENRIPVNDKVLVFSGRISSEVLTKAAKIGVGIVLSKSAPTDLAIRLAEDLNITAIGFIRGDSFNIYSHPWRVVQKNAEI
ncbi:formate dehydrogenase accessory sulfurtransferase FdhD [Salinicoccus halodurans]|uniref:Sulfur carrier protein FdhD n=1 Tax=Salinicoccus halodurans TaxID=407035 RepID=A0A0F7HIP9_9STAP|nr:formate dehydrogenase accessory sulfurtransferase FdhD [Salinicoccus halodurans]AKG72937.1 formate dehydrogenase [Salinicoccus halodurans]SFK76407.1 FdhD protein [Salinicoccus halodurans]